MSNFGIMDPCYFVSKSQIFKWISSLLPNKPIHSIEHLGSGEIYCDLITHSFPNKQLITGTIENPKLEHEYVHNLRLFQRALDRLKTEKKIDILKVARCRYLDNLEVVQWLKRFLETYEERRYGVAVGGGSGNTVEVKRVNSPRLCTSPSFNLGKKKVGECGSPRVGLGSPMVSRFSYGSRVGKEEEGSKEGLRSPNKKLSDIRNLLKSGKSEEEKLGIIKELIFEKQGENKEGNQNQNQIKRGCGQEEEEEQNDVL